MNQLKVDWFAAILWTEPEPQPSLVQSGKDRNDVVFEVLAPSTMDNAAYFWRYEDRSALQLLRSEQLLFLVDGQRPQRHVM